GDARLGACAAARAARISEGAVALLFGAHRGCVALGAACGATRASGCVGGAAAGRSVGLAGGRTDRASGREPFFRSAAWGSQAARTGGALARLFARVR